MSSGLELISVYGPPGSGKSVIGRELASRLNLPFWDIDEEIQTRANMSIPEIFDQEGEAGFRQRESALLAELVQRHSGVLALGGGALLDPENRTLVEAAGPVICLDAPYSILLDRLKKSGDARPLVAGDLAERLTSLLERRSEHYASFPFRLGSSLPIDQVVWEAQIRLGIFHVSGMGRGYDVRIRPGNLSAIGRMLLSRELSGPVVIVSDLNVAPVYAETVVASLEAAGYCASLVTIPPGEANKNMQTIATLWEELLSAKIERSSTVLALGGGVVGDTAGFAAAMYLRGVPWVVVPTTLLAMADASLGGKTGVDLPQGKNLVGAFHPPRLVLADPLTLATLPESELRSGMAEVVKAGVIGDPVLFELCRQGWVGTRRNLEELVRRAMAVKISVIESDPYERGIRASLNLGHTVGHAVELASGFRLRHGEAVAIGMAVEARLAERLGLAEDGLSQRIIEVLTGLDLPVEIPQDLDRNAIRIAMQADKKRLGGSVRFALPVRIGQVRVGVEFDVNHRDAMGTDMF